MHARSQYRYVLWGVSSAYLLISLCVLSSDVHAQTASLDKAGLGEIEIAWEAREKGGRVLSPLDRSGAGLCSRQATAHRAQDPKTTV